MQALPTPARSSSIGACSKEAADGLHRLGIHTTTAEQVGRPAVAIVDAARDGVDLVVSAPATAD